MRLIVFTFLFFIACNGQHNNKNIKNDIDSIKIIKISFNEVSDSSPIDEKEEIIDVYEITQDSIFKKEKIFSYQKLIHSKTLKSNAHNNEETLLNVPKKYIYQPEKFSFLNFIPENDGNYIQVILQLENNTEKKWNLSYNHSNYPNDFLYVIKLIEDSKNRLNSK